MKRLALLLSTAAVSVTTCSVPAHADPEIPAPAEAGQVNVGWARVSCSGTSARQWCHLRFPDGFRRLDVAYVHGGDGLGSGATFDHDTPGRVRDEIRRFDRRVVSGVRVSCMTVGAWVDCTVRIRERVRRYEDTYWSDAANMGGIIWQADPATTTTPTTTRSAR